MGTTQLAICNAALELIKSQDLLTAGTFPNFVGTPAVAAAANVLYGPTRDLLLREINPEFARITIAGVPVNATPIVPWLYEYQYPADGLRIRQVRPPVGSLGALADPFERLPVPAAVAYDNTARQKVVLTNQQNALLVYTSNLPPELVWDPDFAEAMSDRLSRPFAMALAGRPDYAREMLEVAEKYAALATENGDL